MTVVDSSDSWSVSAVSFSGWRFEVTGPEATTGETLNYSQSRHPTSHARSVVRLCEDPARRLEGESRISDLPAPQRIIQ